jgi:tetratricopeptide (TPR) repeat protein
VAQDPDNLEALMNLSMALIKTDQQDEAIALLQTIEEKDKWNPQVHYLLGTHFMGAEDWIKAKAHLEKALTEQPDFEDAAINLALVLCELGETLEAVRQMRPVIRRMPQSAAINFFYGLTLYRHGDWKDALAKYRKALELDPAHLSAKVAMGETLIRLNDLPEAERSLRLAVQEAPQHLPSLFLMGLCRMRQAETETSHANQVSLWEKAQACFEKILTLEPSHLEAEINLSLLAGLLGSPETLNVRFELLLSKFGEDKKAIILFYWAEALTKIGQSTLAQEKLIEAQALIPDIQAQMESVTL